MPPGTRRHTAVVSLAGLTLLSVGAAFLPRLADVYWAFELPGHFRAHLGVLVTALAAGLAALRAWNHLVLAAVAWVLVVEPVLELWIPHESVPQTSVVLRVLSLNVSFKDQNYDEVFTLLRDRDPDIVGLVEVNNRWATELATLGSVYPYQLHKTTSRSGVALLSRVPFESATIRPFVTRRRNLAVADLLVQGRPVRLVVAHTLSPVRGARAALRDAQLDVLAAIGRESPGRDVIVVGDFNTSPWSLAFHRLIIKTNWRNAARGFGYWATWPAGVRTLGIPIDHHIVSDGIVVHFFAVVGPTGSDHLAVYSELGFR